MTAQESKPNIYQRKNAVMRKIRYLKKDGLIQFGNQKYKAVTHDAVIGVLRGHLVEHGIDIGVTVTDHQLAGKTTIADIDLILTNIDDPQDRVTYHGFAYGENSDKGPGSAISYAVKNLLLKAFAIETGESDEARFELDTEPETITDDQASTIRTIADEVGADIEAFCRFLKVDAIESLPAGQYKRAVAALEKKRAKEIAE